MRIYKQGDKVRILKTVNYEGTDLSRKYTTGDICEVAYATDEDCDTQVYTKDKSYYSCFAQDAIEPAEKTWDTLGARDVLVNGGVELVVQGVIGEIVLYTSNTGDKSREFSYDASKLELQRDGFTIKQPEQADEVIELTLDDVAKLKGVSVEKIRIKE